MKTEIKSRLLLAFRQDRVVCRLFAAWMLWVAFLLLTNTGYHDISFLQEELSVFSAVLWTVILFVLASVPAYFAGERFHTDSHLLLIGSTLSVVRWVVEFSGYAGGPFVTLGAAVVYVLILWWVVQQNRELIAAVYLGQKAALAIGISAAVLSCFFIATIGVLRYKTFSTPNFDFGIFCNMFHNMKETGLPLVTCERDKLLSHFAVHLSPAYYLLLPFYFIFPDPSTLAVGQAVVLMLGVVPVYLLCRHFQFSGKMTALLCVLYAFYPPLTTGCFYDIHENCFLPLFLLWMFYCFEKKKYIPMYLMAVMVLSVKEDAALYVLIFGMYLLLSRRNWYHGIILSAVSLGYFLLAVNLLQTQGDGLLAGAHFGSLMYDEEGGLMGVVKTALINPGFLVTQLFKGDDPNAWSKLWFFIQLFLPLGLLPFATKKASRWLLITPVLVNLLTNYIYQHDTGFHYQFGVCALAFYAMLLNIEELKGGIRRPLLTLAVSVTLCLYLSTGFSSFTINLDNYNQNKEQFRRMEEILDTIPDDASVASSSFLLPYLAQRSEIYEVGYHSLKTDIDYVVLDMRYDAGGADGWSRYLNYYDSQQYETVIFEENLIAVLKYNPAYQPVVEDD